jgi:hypothetical protein
MGLCLCFLIAAADGASGGGSGDEGVDDEDVMAVEAGNGVDDTSWFSSFSWIPLRSL